MQSMAADDGVLPLPLSARSQGQVAVARSRIVPHKAGDPGPLLALGTGSGFRGFEGKSSRPFALAIAALVMATGRSNPEPGTGDGNHGILAKGRAVGSVFLLISFLTVIFSGDQSF